MSMSSIKIVFNEKENPSDEDLIKWINENSINHVVNFITKRNGNKVLIEFEECSDEFSEVCHNNFFQFELSNFYAHGLTDTDSGSWEHVYIREGGKKEIGLYVTHDYFCNVLPKSDVHSLMFWQMIGFTQSLYDLFHDKDFEKDMKIVLNQIMPDLSIEEIING